LAALAALASAVAAWAQWQAVASGWASSDLALYANALFNSGPQSGFLYSAHLDAAFGAPSFLAEHFTPSLVLLAPLLRVGGPGALAVLGALTPAMTAGLAFAWLRSEGADRGAAAAAASALLLAPLYWVAAADPVHGFHHDTLVPPLFFALALAWSRGSRWIWPCLLLLLGMKEEIPVMGLWIALLGLWRGAKPSRRWWLLGGLSAAVALLPWLWSLLSGVVQRHHDLAGALLALPPASLLWAALPGWRWALYLPGFALQPLAWLMLAPELWLQLRFNPDAMAWRYLTAFALAGAAHAWTAWRWASSPSGDRRRRWGALLLWGLPLLLLPGTVSQLSWAWSSARQRPYLVQAEDLRRLAALVPEEQSLVAPSYCLTALARRPRLLWPGQEAQAQAVIAAAEPRAPFAHEDQKSLRAMRDGLADGTWRLVAHAGKLALYAPVGR
jgi:hypothetical protein